MLPSYPFSFSYFCRKALLISFTKGLFRTAVPRYSELHCSAVPSSGSKNTELSEIIIVILKTNRYLFVNNFRSEILNYSYERCR